MDLHGTILEKQNHIIQNSALKSPKNQHQTIQPPSSKLVQADPKGITSRKTQNEDPISHRFVRPPTNTIDIAKEKKIKNRT